MPDTAPTLSGSNAAAISNLTVSLLREYTGRGPTKARTFVNEDMVTVVLQDTLTKGETTLVQHDNSALVLTTRASYQDAMAADLRAGVERVMQREVVAFISANHIAPDIAVEIFFLAPTADADPAGGAGHNGTADTSAR